MTGRLTVVTLGVSDMRRSIAFYGALGFARRMAATGEEVAFFAAGGCVLGLYPWDSLAAEAGQAGGGLAAGFRGYTLAWNCSDRAEVEAAFRLALAAGAKPLKHPQSTSYGGYAGYFADPDGHVWEIVQAPGIEVGPEGRATLPD